MIRAITISEADAPLAGVTPRRQSAPDQSGHPASFRFGYAVGAIHGALLALEYGNAQGAADTLRAALDALGGAQ